MQCFWNIFNLWLAESKDTEPMDTETDFTLNSILDNSKCDDEKKKVIKDHSNNYFFFCLLNIILDLQKTVIA
jgi:hypothetical protein